jgi:hypothetical protein
MEVKNMMTNTNAELVFFQLEIARFFCTVELKIEEVIL